MSTSYSLILKRPAEVEEITGLTVTMQRDWRKRGFLPEMEGHARFNCFEVADIFLRKKLSDRGFGPKRFDRFGAAAGYVLVKHALTARDSYEAREELTGRELGKIRSEILDLFLRSANDATMKVDTVFIGMSRFAVIYERTMSYTNDIKGALESGLDDPDMSMPIVIDVHREACHFVKRFGPLVTVGNAEDEKAA